MEPKKIKALIGFTSLVIAYVNKLITLLILQFLEEDKQPLVIQSNCTDNSRGVPCWYYSQKGDATKWSSYKCVYDLPPSIHCKTNKITEPCVTQKETRFGFSYPFVKVPIRTWNDQPTTSFVCGLSKGNGRVLDENCWSVMLTVKYSQGKSEKMYVS